MNELAEIANKMIEQARNTKEPVSRKLKSGLTITYAEEKDHRQISLTRWAAQASLSERTDVRKIFGVPGWVTQLSNEEIKYINGYGVIRIKWNASRHSKLLKLGQAHLAPGWSVNRIEQLLKSYGLNSWLDADDDTLDRLLTDIIIN